MKFVALSGGLGNQLFVYAFCLELRNRGHKVVLFKPNILGSASCDHQGYELKKIFYIQEFTDLLSFFCSNLLSVYYFALKLYPLSVRKFFLKLINVYSVAVPNNFIFYPEIFNFKHKNEIFWGTWQSEKYFSNSKKEVLNAFKFRNTLISKINKEMGMQIQVENSVSIHIRRGDYLTSPHGVGFINICSLNYYIRAVNYIHEHIKNPKFYVFSDDPDWVKENLVIENAKYINHNTGKDSWQDMYLMSICKHNIIANSSFSWWGAWLNQNVNKIVIAPKKWWAFFEEDDVVPDNWIKLA
jgi:hypothetical protein